MIHELTIDAIAAAKQPNGKVKLVLSPEQLTELCKDTASLPTQEHLVEARTLFFDYEGYMASDDMCLLYWDDYHGTH